MSNPRQHDCFWKNQYDRHLHCFLSLQRRLIVDSTTVLVKTSMTVIYTVSCLSVSFSLFQSLSVSFSLSVSLSLSQSLSVSLSLERVGCRIQDNTSILGKTSMTVIYTVSCLSREGWLSNPRQHDCFGKNSMTVIYTISCLFAMRQGKIFSISGGTQPTA